MIQPTNIPRATPLRPLRRHMVLITLAGLCLWLLAVHFSHHNHRSCRNIDSLLLYHVVCRRLSLVVAIVSSIGVGGFLHFSHIRSLFCNQDTRHRCCQCSNLHSMDIIGLFLAVSCTWRNWISGFLLFCVFHL
jgi:hypothetical protein